MRRPSPIGIRLALAALAALAAWPGTAAFGAAGPSDAAAPATSVAAVSATGYRVTVPIGDAAVVRGDIAGVPVDEISIPEGVDLAPAGEPQLPARRVLLRVPWGVTPRVRAIPSGLRPLGPLRPAPFARLLGEAAARGRWSAAEVVGALASPRYRARRERRDPLIQVADMAARGTRILSVDFAPVVWDPGTGIGSQFDRVDLEVSWDRAVEPTESAPPAGGGKSGDPLDPHGALGPRYGTRAFGRAGGRQAAGPSAGTSALRSQAGGPLRVDPSRPWVRLGTTRLGLYRVTPADLAAAGANVGAIDPATIRIFRATPGDLSESADVDLGPDSLRECAIEVMGDGDGVFDPGDAVVFFGTGSFGVGDDLLRGGGPEYRESERSFEASYWLTWGPGPGASPPRRVGTRSASPLSPMAPLLASTTHTIHFEQNRIGDFDLASPGTRWERWFERLVAEGARLTFPLSLPSAVPGGAGSARFRLWGANSSVGIGLPDHVARLLWNGTVVDTAGWNFNLPQDLVASGLSVGVRDTLDVAIPNLNEPGDPNRTDIQYTAWFEVSYPRRLEAAADTLFFVAPDSAAPGRVRYAISAVGDTTTARLYDRTDPESVVRLAGGAWSGGSGAFTLTFEDSAGPGHRPRYALLSTARTARPATIQLYAPPVGTRTIGDLLDPANEADYLVIAPPAFLAAAESLAADRSSFLEGVPAPRARIATTDRIFAQFGGGTPGPTPIRNFLAYAVRHWARAPVYACLLGDASGDPLNYSGLRVTDYVPTYADGYDPVLGEQFVMDDWLARLDGPTDQLLDLAVGRLPARTPEEALAFVREKRRVLEGNMAFDLGRCRALLSADDAWKWSAFQQADPVGLDHTRQMERKDRLHLPGPLARAKVYLNDYAFADSSKTSKPGAREAFIAAVNRGNWLVDYIGHGSGSLLADEQLFRALDIARLTNAALPSIWAFMSCTVGRFDDYRQDGLAELLLRHPTGGAGAAIAASQEVFGIESTNLNDAFVDELFPLAPRTDSLRTAGLAWALAKNRAVNFSVRKYNFLGEPGVRPPVPRGRGVWEKSPLDSVLRGEVVTLRGHAVFADGTADTVATGTARLRVLGPPSRRLLVGGYAGIPGTVPYDLPGPVVYQGDVSLDRGAFEVRLTIPVDGRLSGRGARLEALLEEAGGRGVGLAVDSLVVAAGLSPRVDVTPPTIALLGPADTTFAPGDRVTFALEDSSGIDLTRFDNAHAIFVLFDDAGLPIDLTSGFAYERGSSTRGSVDLLLPPLSAGAHRLEVHASDTYRNIGVATFVIEVAPPAAPGEGLDLSQVFNYPNPFANETYLHVRLNRAARLKITILTVAGRRVHAWAVDGKAGENYIPWDGRDSRGENTAIGVYLFHVTAEAPGGGRVDAVGKALRTR